MNFARDPESSASMPQKNHISSAITNGLTFKDLQSDINLIPRSAVVMDFLYQPDESQKDTFRLVFGNVESVPMGGDWDKVSKHCNLTPYSYRCLPYLSKNDVLAVDKNDLETVRENLEHLLRVGMMEAENLPRLFVYERAVDKTMMQNVRDAFVSDQAELHTFAKVEQNEDFRLAPEIQYINNDLRKMFGEIVPFINTKDVDQFVQEMQSAFQLNINVRRNGATTTQLNHKGEIMQQLQNAGLITAHGEMARSRAEFLKSYLSMRRFLRNEYPGKNERIIMKEPMSASGGGIHKSKGMLKDLKFIATFPKKRLEHGMLLEEMVTDDKFDLVEASKGIKFKTGVVIHVEPGKDNSPENPKVTLLSVSEQIEDENGVHKGNLAPGLLWSNNMKKSILEYARILARSGAYGNAGLDFLNGIPSDPNSRFTGSQHPALSLHKLGIQYKSVDEPILVDMNSNEYAVISDNNFAIPKGMSIREVENHLASLGLLFQADNGRRGAYVTNHATYHDGKTQIVFVRNFSPEELKRVKEDGKEEVSYYKHRMVTEDWEEAKESFKPKEQTVEEAANHQNPEAVQSYVRTRFQSTALIRSFWRR